MHCDEMKYGKSAIVFMGFCFREKKKKEKKDPKKPKGVQNGASGSYVTN